MDIPKNEREMPDLPTDGFTKITYHNTEDLLLASS